VTKSEIVGRTVFAKKEDGFFVVEGVYPPMEACIEMGETISLIDCATGETSCVHWLSEIGENFVLLPHDFPRSEIDRFNRAVAERDAATEVILDIAADILLSDL